MHLQSSPVAQQVKDPVLSLLWRGFDPWPRNFRLPWSKKKKKRSSLGVLNKPPLKWDFPKMFSKKKRKGIHITSSDHRGQVQICIFWQRLCVGSRSAGVLVSFQE